MLLLEMPPITKPNRDIARQLVDDLARTFDVLIAPFRTAPTMRVERRHDLANIVSQVMPQLKINSQSILLLN